MFTNAKESVITTLSITMMLAVISLFFTSADGQASSAPSQRKKAAKTAIHSRLCNEKQTHAYRCA